MRKRRVREEIEEGEEGDGVEKEEEDK